MIAGELCPLLLQRLCGRQFTAMTKMTPPVPSHTPSQHNFAVLSSRAKESLALQPGPRQEACFGQQDASKHDQGRGWTSARTRAAGCCPETT